MARGLFEFVVFKYRIILPISVRVISLTLKKFIPLQRRHYGRDGVSNHQPHHCLLNRLFRRRSKKTSKLRVTGLCAGNLAVTGEFPAQRASNADHVSIWWRHYAFAEMPLRNLKCIKYEITTALDKTPNGYKFYTAYCMVKNTTTPCLMTSQMNT